MADKISVAQLEGSSTSINAHEPELGEIHTAAKHHGSLNKRIVWNNIWGSIGGYIFGYSSNVIANTLAQPSFAEHFNFATTSNLAGLTGAIVCMFHVGAFFGFQAQGYVADKWGRKRGALFSASLALIGNALTGASTSNKGMLLFARFLTGFGAFPCAMNAIMYCSELSVAETRGFLAGIVGFSIGLGYTLSCWVGTGFFFLDSAQAWRGPVLLGCLFPLLYICLLPTVDESPRWLSNVGRYDEAKEVLIGMHKSQLDPEDTYAKYESALLQAQAEIDKHLDGSWRAIITKPGNRKRCALVLLAVTGQMCTGIQAILAFGPSLYSSLGYGTGDQLFFSAGFNTLSPLESIMMMYLCDRMGRRAMIATCPIASAVCLFIYSGIVAIYGGSDNNAGKAAAVAMLFVFFFCYLFIEVAVFVFIGEIFPTHTRAKGISVGLSGIAIHSIWTTLATPSGLEVGGYKFMFLFGGLSLVNGFLILKYFPETKGMQLEEIANLLGEHNEVAVVRGDVSRRPASDLEEK